jgi:signal transduction histidine kinase
VSLRTRIVLAAAYLLTVGVVALEVPLARNVSQRAVSEFQATVLGNAAIVAAQVADEVARSGSDPDRPPDPPARLARVVAENARAVEGRIVVTDALGRALADSEGRAPVGSSFLSSEREEFVVALRDGQIDTRRRFSDTAGEELLLVTVPVTSEDRVVGAVRVSNSLAEVREGVLRSWIGLGAIGAAVVVVGVGLAWVLAGSLARPVSELEEVAVRLGEGDLDARARPEGPREVRTLARSFNRMAAALSANLSAQRDFVANASHQLRTPLTGLRLRLEALEARGGPVAEEARKMRGELDRLAGLVEDLLELARASSAESTGSHVDLAAVAREAVDRWAAPAAEAGKTIRLLAAPVPPVWANPGDLGHVLDNLIENAIRYTPAGTEIVVEAGDGEGGPYLSVADDGPGIPPEDRDRVFDRFYRGRAGRRAGPGTGLGLPIVAELVRRWDGEVRLADAGGTRVEARFPRRIARS